MIVSELLNSMNKDFRENLWDITIDDNGVEDVFNFDDISKEDLEKEIKEWYFKCYIDGQTFVQRLIIETVK